MTWEPRACSVDPFSKKDWYEIKAPSAFSVRNVGKTLVTRTAGTKVGGLQHCSSSHSCTPAEDPKHAGSHALAFVDVKLYV